MEAYNIMKKKPLPAGRDLVMLAREYVDKDWVKMKEDAPGLEYEFHAQKAFMKVINWLKEKGY